MFFDLAAVFSEEHEKENKKNVIEYTYYYRRSDFMAFDRIDRVSEEVKRELASIIRDLKDPRLPQMISVVNVNVTKDFKFANCTNLTLLNDD